MKLASITAVVVAGTCTVAAFAAYVWTGKTEIVDHEIWARIDIAPDGGNWNAAEFNEQAFRPEGQRPGDSSCLGRQADARAPRQLTNSTSAVLHPVSRELLNAAAAKAGRVSAQSNEPLVRRDGISMGRMGGPRVRTAIGERVYAVGVTEVTKASGSASRNQDSTPVKGELEAETLDSDLSAERIRARKDSLTKVSAETAAQNSAAPGVQEGKRSPRRPQESHLTPEQALLSAQVGAQSFAAMAFRAPLEKPEEGSQP